MSLSCVVVAAVNSIAVQQLCVALICYYLLENPNLLRDVIETISSVHPLAQGRTPAHVRRVNANVHAHVCVVCAL